MKTTQIKITVTCDETIEVVHFSNSRIGQSKSVKFLEGLKKEYVSSPYLTKINELKKQIGRNWGHKKWKPN